jgi:hypothetical protein
MITEREKFAGNPTNGEAQLPIRKAFMTRDDIFRIAVQAGARPSLSPELWDFWNIRNADLERFVALVAAHERERLVQVSPLEFVTAVLEKEHLVGKPLMWAQWPNEEKNT